MNHPAIIFFIMIGVAMSIFGIVLIVREAWYRKRSSS